jgi:uncharacterized phage-associated protein
MLEEETMLSYRKERIDNAILFFAHEHYKKTQRYLSQTELYKYLAFFEFHYLTENGEMPLELTYKAMAHGPVPMEIYDHRSNAAFFSLVTFEPFQPPKGKPGYRIRPNGNFDADYFSEAELTEMKRLIGVFAQEGIDAATMSEASHQSIKSWQKAYSRKQNAVINPLDEFQRDITNIPEGQLSSAEERYLLHRKIAELTA